jgi:hypothetical protein
MPPPSIAGYTAKINRILRSSSSNSKHLQKPWSSVKSHSAGGPILYGFSSRNPPIFRTVASRWHPFNGFVFPENNRTHEQETFCLARTLRTMFYTFLFSSPYFWRNCFCTLQVNMFFRINRDESTSMRLVWAVMTPEFFQINWIFFIGTPLVCLTIKTMIRNYAFCSIMIHNWLVNSRLLLIKCPSLIGSNKLFKPNGLKKRDLHGHSCPCRLKFLILNMPDL